MTRRLGRLPGLFFFWLLVLVLAACRPAAAPEPRLGPPAAPDLRFDRLFQRNDGGWTGGDGTLSVALPDGRTLWLFGDTFLGGVDAQGQRAPDSPFIRNSLVVQQDWALGTLYRTPASGPSAFFPAAAPGQWYWPGHGVVEGDQVRVFLHRFEQIEPRLWGFRWVGTDLATLRLPSLVLSGIVATGSSSDVMYGVCLLPAGGFIYIYGTADRQSPKKAHLARSHRSHLDGPWEYFSSKGWSGHPAASTAILSGVSTQYAVVAFAERFYLFSMDGSVPFSDLLVAFQAEHPEGPWLGPVSVYRAPQAEGQVVAYNPFAHPQFSEGDEMLVSYNLNHISNPQALYRNAALYRPRFIRVNLSELEQRFARQFDRTGNPHLR